MSALVVLVVLLLLTSLGTGPVRLPPLTVLDALFGGGSDVQQIIVREIRLPRAILAFAIGAILGLSGAALQGLLRNPLASPSLFGAPQSAAFGAVPSLRKRTWVWFICRQRARFSPQRSGASVRV